MRRSPEFDLIAKVRERFAGGGDARHVLGIGDDAAITVPAGATATTIDALLDGVHFRLSWCPPRAAGAKAIAAALSDLAAMGATAGEAYVWLGLPEDLGEAAVLEICDGIAEVAAQTSTVVLGGDLTRAPALAIAVTAVGHASSAAQFIGRSGAEAGCALCVTGSLGGAAAGLILLEQPDLSAVLGAGAREAVIARQLRPRPLLDVGAALARAGAVAMIDISDGLGADAEQLAAASGVGIEIEVERVPAAAGVAEIAAASGRDRDRLITGGGEDYELLCALPRAAVGPAREAVEAAGCSLTEIGEVVSGGGVRLRLADGRMLAVAGHDHLRPA